MRYAIALLMVLACSTFGQFKLTTPTGIKALSGSVVTSVPLTCTDWSTTNAIQNTFDGIDNTSFTAQKLNIFTPQSICSIDLYAYDASDRSMYLSLSSGKTNSGTIYGYSDTNVISTSIGVKTFIFTSPVSVSGDVWLNLLSTGIISRVYYTITNHYEGAPYYLILRGTERTNYDLYFKIKTMQ